MKTLPTEAEMIDAPEPAPRPLPRHARGGAALPADLLLRVIGEDGAARWIAIADGAVVGEGEGELPAAPRTALAVPGADVAMHWIALDEGLSEAQRAGAARLMLAEASAAPIEAMHVAVGRPEGGLTPVALVPLERMAAWIEAAPEASLIVPTHSLLPPPEAGLRRHDGFGTPDWRGPAEAFSLEEALAGPLVGDRPVETLDAEAFASTLPAMLEDPLLNLRQGPFGRRRGLRVEQGIVRRLALLALAFALISLIVELVWVMRYTFAADRMEAEAAALGTAGAAPEAGGGVAALAGPLFEAVRATPNAELARIEFAGGALTATVTGDSPATLDALRQRVEAAGLVVQPGPPRSAGGRPSADLTVRAR